MSLVTKGTFKVFIEYLGRQICEMNTDAPGLTIDAILSEKCIELTYKLLSLAYVHVCFP
jgi:hypothetical protein